MSHIRQAIDFRWLYLFLQAFKTVATLEIGEFFHNDAAKNLFFRFSTCLIPIMT
jgi:hypothetical protein